WGSNDDQTFFLLFDPLSVNEPDVAGVDQHFTLATWNGRAPPVVNKSLTPGLVGCAGGIGDEQLFNLGSTSDRYYAFRTSTLAIEQGGELEQEVSAVAE